MAADESLQPQQFGPYTIKHDPLKYRTVVAETARGTNVGYLVWDKPGRSGGGLDPARATINSVRVGPKQRGKGIADAMLQHALQHEPSLQHDHALTPDGKRFAARNPL